MTDDAAFHPGELEAQQRWSTAGLWDPARQQRLLWDRIPETLHERIEGAPFFFLATSSPDGRCDCSYKGGGPGLLRILDSRRFAFPDFEGNGAFMSLGNILLNPRVGCLFIDFADGARLRVNGRATIHERGSGSDGDDPVACLFPDSPRVILVDVEEVVPNCPRHIPLLQAVDTKEKEGR